MSSDRDWQPIESAPKDGTAVDLWDGEKRHTDYRWRAEGLAGWTRREWQGGESGFATTRLLLVPVTHWMLVPEGPRVR